MSHEHSHGVYTRCWSCCTWGINFPGEMNCGNCGSKDTSTYRPECCFEELERKLAIAVEALEKVAQLSENLNEQVSPDYEYMRDARETLAALKAVGVGS